MQRKYKEIWPRDLGDLGLPVWGDTIIVPSTTKGSCVLRARGQQATVILAKLPMAPLSGTSVKSLLKAATRIRLALTRRCGAGPLPNEAREEVAVEVKTALEHYRSVLDYIA